MQIQHSQRQHNSIHFLLLSLFCILLVSCSGKSDDPSVTPSANTPAPSITIENNETNPEIPSLQPTPTPSVVDTPTPQVVTTDKNSGLVILAKGDGFFTHLFAYGPDSTPLTRLTADNWDDTDPALSPDGTKVAFTSNRSGYWDIYVLDLKSGSTQQMTQTPTYDGAPAWSPDGQYLIYQTLDGANLDLLVQSVVDLTSAPIQLTDNSGDNYDPAWSPDGHTIAFITNRSGQSELWLADLQNIKNRFSVLQAEPQTDYSTPRWSPDGSTLAWCEKDSESHIETIVPGQINALPQEVGLGCNPVWSSDGSIIMASLDQPNSHYLVAYQIKQAILFFSPIQVNTQIQSFDWISAEKSNTLTNFLNIQNLSAPKALFSPTLSLPLSTTGRKGIVDIKDVTAPHPYLADSSDEAFYALRQGIGQKSGWDFLASLENAYLPVTEIPSPGITQNWLYTGRAIDVNTIPIDAGWMAVTREDYNGLTYWRVWIKCLKQDGTCGTPMLTIAWDFSARFDSEPEAYENGGKYSSIPNGYWIDFTEFANRYGWNRVPSQANWRYYYPGILFNQFIYSENLSWTNAMLDLYPAEVFKSMVSGN
jgi:TolB protein